MRTQRRGRGGGCHAQAVLETALVIPIMLLLVCNFIAVMLQVTVQQQLDSATALAAESRFQAPQGEFDPTGASCCPDPRCCAGAAAASPLSTAGIPTGCRYAGETFYGTMQGYTSILRWRLAPLCLSGGDSAHASQPFGGASAYPGVPLADVSCVVGATTRLGQHLRSYLDRSLNPPNGLDVVTCDATATLDFSKTPLAWGVFWSPTLHAHAETLPPPFRQ